MNRAIFLRLPYFFRLLLVSFYNWWTLHKKYGFIPIVNSMKKVENDLLCGEKIFLDEDEVVKKINHLVDHACSTTPYYAENLRFKHISLAATSDLSKFPLLTKDFLRSNCMSFHALTEKSALTLQTSGSTGSPLFVRVFKKDLRSRYCKILVAKNQQGISLSRGYARFIAQDIFDAARPWYWDALNSHLLLSVKHLNAENSIEYLEILKKYKIRVLEGYPSVISEFAKISPADKRIETQLRHVIVTAEKLTEHQNSVITENLGVKIFDFYGSNDQSVFIFSCPENRYHIANSTGHTELLPANDEDPDGSHRRIVVTSFTSYAMPLIRYDIGDTCVLSDTQSCGCGRPGPVLKELIGRCEDVYETEGASKIYRTSLALKHLPINIYESQLLVRQRKNDITLNYTCDVSLAPEAFQAFESAWKSLADEEFSFSYKRVSTLVREASGKRKAVVVLP